MEGPWTILELTELAADALAAGRGSGSGSGSVRANGRGRDVPNERLVRWYVTVGLVDPPLSRRGRVAQYGRRHLLQLVAVKRRQAEGRSLAEIQAELSGATDETLAAVAQVPEALATPEAPGPARDRFWARPSSQREADTAGRAEERGADGTGGIVQGVRLARGVTLLLEGGGRGPGPEDVTAIVNAARALLAELASRNLCEPGSERLADAPGHPK
jgi:DNA-binding transcriptional MerR regulator